MVQTPNTWDAPFYPSLWAFTVLGGRFARVFTSYYNPEDVLLLSVYNLESLYVGMLLP
jgi:hypothetical protein